MISVAQGFSLGSQGFNPGIKNAQNTVKKGVHALPQNTHTNDLSRKGVNAL
jgi:hypothetical protein